VETLVEGEAMSLFKKAQKRRVPLKIAIDGPSGSGKTMTSLLLAYGIHGPNAKIAVIDTENESSSLYSGTKIEAPGFGLINFDVAPMSPPFMTNKYIMAIKEATEAKYDVIIIDSGSHAWSGPGGILERKDLADMRPGSNKWTNWMPFTKEHNAMMSAVLHSPVDVIFTMRSKQDYVLEQRGEKSAPKKVGMAPQQREGVEYEFSVAFSVDMNHILSANKDRTTLFKNKLFELDAQTTIQIGKDLAAWRSSDAAEVPPVKIPEVQEPAQSKEPEDHPLFQPDDHLPENAPQEKEQPPKPATAPAKKQEPAENKASGIPKGTDTASKQAIDELIAYGRKLKIHDERMAELMAHRTGKSRWSELTNFEIKTLRNAFQDDGRKSQ
jgi:hypothetical protein